MFLHNLCQSSIFFKCKTLKHFKEAHSQLILRGLNHTPTSLRPIISFSSLDPSGNIRYSLLLLLFRTPFASSSSSSSSLLFLFNTVIRGLARTRSGPAFAPGSLLVLSRMAEIGLAPNGFTFTFLFHGCSSCGAFDLGKRFHGVLVKNSLGFDVFVRNSVIQFYSVFGDLIDARKVFDESSARDIVSWNSIINGYVRNGLICEAKKLFDEMPDRNDVSWNCVLGGAVKFGSFDDAYGIFSDMPRKSLVSWIVMISGCAQRGRPKEALALFREMLSSNQEPNCFVLVSVLSACSQLGALDLGNWIYSYIQKRDLVIDSILSAALIDMYSKCGCIELAMQLFDKSKHKCVSTYTAAISGLAMNGCGDEALQLFDSMISKGVSPDSVSFVAVLSACSHDGWVDKGFRYFNSMSVDYEIRPELDHYACMVDLLGRAGRLEEARKFIASMPIKPDNVVWGALLGACRVHGDAEMGHRIGNLLMQSDQDHDGRYVVLSNIYAESMKGEDAEKVRTAMRKRNIKRVPGCSLIEVEGVVHEFLAGDKSHERAEEIYCVWNEIVTELKKFGYVAELRGVSFDIEEEEKENQVGYHSEKLALAYGFICTKPGTVIRIVKNIRICNDCHSAFKLVSNIFKRKISVRDRKRYHHFVEGKCSCMDYW